jgi:hypothetical protein
MIAGDGNEDRYTEGDVQPLTEAGWHIERYIQRCCPATSSRSATTRRASSHIASCGRSGASTAPADRHGAGGDGRVHDDAA